MNQSRLGRGRVRFLAHIDEIKAELLAGYSMQETHEKFAQRLLLHYSTFRKYVRQFIGPVPASRLRAPASKLLEPKVPLNRKKEIGDEPSQTAATQGKKSDEPRPRFHLNRRPDPNILEQLKPPRRTQ